MPKARWVEGTIGRWIRGGGTSTFLSSPGRSYQLSEHTQMIQPASMEGPSAGPAPAAPGRPCSESHCSGQSSLSSCCCVMPALLPLALQETLDAENLTRGTEAS